VQSVTPRLISIVITSYHLRLILPTVLFPSGFPTKTVTVRFHSCYMPCPSHPPCLDYSNCITSYENPHYAFFLNLITSSLFGQIILLGTLFANTLNLCSFRRRSFTPIQNYSFLLINLSVSRRQTRRQQILN
jgi:hypothetical protein